MLVVGSSVFPYYPYIPGPLLGPETSLVAITSDPSEAARAPMGDAIVGDVALALRDAGRPGRRSRTPGAPSRAPSPASRHPSNPLTGSEAMAALADAWPDDAIAVVEAPSCTLALRNRLRHLAARELLPRAAAAGWDSASQPRSGCSSRNPSARSCA